MNDTLKHVGRIYIIGAIWFAVMVATGLVLFRPLDVLYATIGAGPELHVLSTMAIAIVAAFVVTGLLWTRTSSVDASERVATATR